MENDYLVVPSIGFVYDESLDSYVLRSNKQIIIDTGDNDILTFSKDQIIQTSGKLYLNPIPFYNFTGDLEMFKHTMHEVLKKRDEELTKVYTEHKLNSDGSVYIPCGDNYN